MRNTMHPVLFNTRQSLQHKFLNVQNHDVVWQKS